MSGHEPLDDLEIWRGRLKEAEHRYRTAGGDDREQARQDYLRVLRIFSDMVIRGKSPSTGASHS